MRFDHEHGTQSINPSSRATIMSNFAQRIIAALFICILVAMHQVRSLLRDKLERDLTTCSKEHIAYDSIVAVKVIISFDFDFGAVSLTRAAGFHTAKI